MEAAGRTTSSVGPDAVRGVHWRRCSLLAAGRRSRSPAIASRVTNPWRSSSGIWTANSTSIRDTNSTRSSESKCSSVPKVARRRARPRSVAGWSGAAAAAAVAAASRSTRRAGVPARVGRRHDRRQPKTGTAWRGGRHDDRSTPDRRQRISDDPIGARPRPLRGAARTMRSPMVEAPPHSASHTPTAHRVLSVCLVGVTAPNEAAATPARGRASANDSARAPAAGGLAAERDHRAERLAVEGVEMPRPQPAIGRPSRPVVRDPGTGRGRGPRRRRAPRRLDRARRRSSATWAPALRAASRRDRLTAGSEGATARRRPPNAGLVAAHGRARRSRRSDLAEPARPSGSQAAGRPPTIARARGTGRAAPCAGRRATSRPAARRPRPAPATRAPSRPASRSGTATPPRGCRVRRRRRRARRSSPTRSCGAASSNPGPVTRPAGGSARSPRRVAMPRTAPASGRAGGGARSSAS